MKIYIAQMEVIPGSPEKNFSAIQKFVEEGRRQDADLVVFPEMAVP